MASWLAGALCQQGAQLGGGVAPDDVFEADDAHLGHRHQQHGQHHAEQKGKDDPEYETGQLLDGLAGGWVNSLPRCDHRLSFRAEHSIRRGRVSCPIVEMPCGGMLQ